MNKFHYVPECWAETIMVQWLFLDGRSSKGDDFCNHADGIASVAKALKMKDVKDYVSVGFIDDDKKNVPLYFSEFRIIENGQAVDFKKHPDSQDYLMVVRPAIEKFLLLQIKEIGKSPVDYQLPAEFELFKKTLKRMSIKDHMGYQKLITDLSANRPPGIDFIISNIGALRQIHSEVERNELQ
jgi:hypothetical protein